MEQLQEWCSNSIVMYLAVTAFAFISGWLASKLPNIWGPFLVKRIEAVFEAGDDADDKFFMAALVWAEEKLGPKRGPEKYKAVVKLMMTKAPLWVRILIGPNTAQVARIFEANFERLRLEVAKAAKTKGIANK